MSVLPAVRLVLEESLLRFKSRLWFKAAAIAGTLAPVLWALINAGASLGLGATPPEESLRRCSPGLEKGRLTVGLCLLRREQRPAEAEDMHRNSSKNGVVLALASRGPDGCQMISRAQLGQEPPQRTVLGVLTENGQYRRACGQVMPGKLWESCMLGKAVMSWWDVGSSRSCRPTLTMSIPEIWTKGKGHSVPFPARPGE